MNTRSLCSPRSGKPLANQWVITTQNGEMFKSYKTMIAIRSWDGQVMLDHDWDYSATTLKYLKIFLEGLHHVSLSKSEIQKRIDDGIFQIGNLNTFIRWCNR